jgi:hypothetical protein
MFPAPSLAQPARAAPCWTHWRRALRASAATLRRGAERAAVLLGRDGLVVRRTDGALGGGQGEPFELLFVGRERFAREFEVYFRDGAAGRVERVETALHGGAAKLALHRRAIAELASEADLVAFEPLSTPAEAGDLVHYPMLSGRLDVEPSFDQQLRQVRSRAKRHLMRRVLREDAYVQRCDREPAALDAFYAKFHFPFVRARFGDRGAIDDIGAVRRLFDRHGSILWVTARERPCEPVCGALLLDEGQGTLAYQINGFSGAQAWGADLMAERMAALELALFRVAIERHARTIDLGYTRGILSDGLFVHKRRLGCRFEPLPGSPAFRVRVRHGRRAAVFARYPLLTGTPDAWTAVLGYDPSGPHASKKAWRATLKGYRIPGLASAVVWARPSAGGAAEEDETRFREAVAETLDLKGGVELRVDA